MEQRHVNVPAKFEVRSTRSSVGHPPFEVWTAKKISHTGMAKKCNLRECGLMDNGYTI